MKLKHLFAALALCTCISTVTTGCTEDTKPKETHTQSSIAKMTVYNEKLKSQKYIERKY